MSVSPTDAYAIGIVGAFLTGAVLDLAGRRDGARVVTVGAWVAFAGFWAVLTPGFLFEELSYVKGLLSAAGVPASVYVGYVLYRGRDSLLTLSRGVAVMGLVYLPFNVFEPLMRPLIWTVVVQVEFAMDALGYAPTLEQGHEIGNQIGLANAFTFVIGDHAYRTEVVLACTGIGSISIFAGLVAAVDAPYSRRFKALAIAVPVIYGLNVIRVTFIALAHGNQWFRGDAIEGAVMTLFGTSNVHRVSYLVADRIIAQSLSVVALVIIALLLVRALPELFEIFEDVLFVVTGDEYDLAGAFGADGSTDETVAAGDD